MKSVFITGGTSGIGAEIAKVYLQDGYRVAVCGRDKEKFDKYLGERENLEFIQLDIKNREQTIKAISDFSVGHSLDIVYANAGRSVGPKKIIPDFSNYHDVIDINLTGVLNTIEPAFNIMRKQGYGHIVAVSSVAGFIGLPGSSAYSASKAGVIKMCETFAIDWKKFNIDVSCVCPGFIKTPLTDKNDHSMPFIMPAEEAAIRIKKAMDKKKVFYAFPKRMFLITRLLEIMPRFLYRKILSIKIFNYSKEK